MRKLLMNEKAARPKVVMEYAPWIDDPDPPERMTPEQLRKLAKGAARLMGIKDDEKK
jgi:hypothetical protein